MTTRRQGRRRWTVPFWHVINPPTRPLAGLAPWWILLETTGRKSGQPRRTPLASGPFDGTTMWVIATQGHHSDFVKNIVARPDVRFRHRGRWHEATATVEEYDESRLGEWNAYARSAPRTFGMDPAFVRLTTR